MTSARERMKFTFDKYRHRDTKLLMNVFVSFMIRGSSIIVSLFTYPAYMRYFPDKIVLGMWFTAISVLSWVLTFDLGVGNGLRNLLVEQIVVGNRKSIKRLIASAYISVAAVVVVFCIITFSIVPMIDWNIFFNFPAEILSNNVLTKMVVLILLGIFLQFLLKLIISILMALQKSFVPGLLNLISTTLMLLFTLFSASGSIEDNVISLAIAFIITTNLPLFFATVIVFWTALRKSVPSFFDFNLQDAIKIGKLGGNFFYLQILTTLIFSTNIYFISWLVSPAEVVEYQIYNRLFSLIGTLFTLAITPIWSAVTEAYVRKEYVWIKELNIKLNKLLLLLVPCQALVIYFLPQILSIWLGNSEIVVSRMYGFVFALYYLLFMKMSIDSSIVSGIGKLKIQSFSLTLTAVLNVVLSIVFLKSTGKWIFTIIASILSILPFVLIEYFDIKRLLGMPININYVRNGEQNV